MYMNTLFRFPSSVRAMPRWPVSVCAALILTACLTPPFASAQMPTVTGYNGTQTFVTSPGKDPDEPNACGVIGGASYWFTYRPPTNGMVSIDTAGSTFDTVLGIYVDNGQNLGYSSLLSVTCNDNCSTNILTSCVQYTASPSTNYFIMLDGVNGATGTARLSYHLQPPPLAINCPANITTNLSSGCSIKVNYPAATVTGGSSILTNYCVPASGSIFPKGANPVSCTVQDTSGQSAAGTFTITVIDATRPTITTPANITTNADPSICSGRAVNFSPTASDNCSGVTTSCNPPSGSIFPIGTNAVTCTASDTSGNTTNCTFKVIVNPNTKAPPTITCSANIVMNLASGCTSVVTYPPSVATPTCTASSIKTNYCSPASGATFSIGVTNVTCTAVDNLNNTNKCTFTVSVLESAPPTITSCPTNRIVTTSATATGSTAVTYSPAFSATDNCAIKTNYCLPPSGSTFPMGTNTVNCISQDKSGNTANCSFTVTVYDTTRPTISNAVNQTVVQACNGTVSYNMPIAKDNCPGVTLSCTPASGTTNFTVAGQVTTNPVTCTATDTSGNVTNASFNLFVTRRLIPTWQPPLAGNNRCIVADDSATEPSNTFTVGGILANRVTFLDLSGSDVTATLSNSVAVQILFSLMNQTGPATATVVSNVVAMVGTGGIGTSGSSKALAGMMKYVASGNYFEFDASTTGWKTNTLNTTQYYRAQVTFTNNVYGTVRFESQ